MDIDEQIYLQNPWFRDRGFLPRESNLRKRSIFDSLFDEVVHIKQITSLMGLRRVGKSTLLKQIIGKLLKDGVNPKHILYFSFDQPTVIEEVRTLERVITFYIDQIIATKIHKISGKVYLFFDEIQLIPYWQDILKRFYDINQNLKFVVSGSASLLISEKSKESLAGRIFERILGPMTFGEYRKFSGSADFIEYLAYGQFPELLEISSNIKKGEYLKDGVIGKVLDIDIVKIFGVRKIVDFERLFWSLLPNTGQIISSQRLMSDLQLKKATLFKYLSILEKSLLINKIVNLSGSFRSEKRLLRKLYPASSNFLALTAESVNIGFKVETYIVSLLSARGETVYLFNQRGKEIDFVLPDRKIAIEVKYQEKIHEEDYRFLKKFTEGKKYKGVLITKSQAEISGEKNITVVPVENFEEFYRI